jgi:hypothetical protein
LTAQTGLATETTSRLTTGTEATATTDTTADLTAGT